MLVLSVLSHVSGVLLALQLSIAVARVVVVCITFLQLLVGAMPRRSLAHAVRGMVWAAIWVVIGSIVIAGVARGDHELLREAINDSFDGPILLVSGRL